MDDAMHLIALSAMAVSEILSAAVRSSFAGGVFVAPMFIHLPPWSRDSGLIRSGKKFRRMTITWTYWTPWIWADLVAVRSVDTCFSLVRN
jgi:hypothetical protein